MSRLRYMSDEASPQAERMSEAAYDLAEESGLAALSARSLARKTGMSPSAINYHIGNRERLIAQIAFKAIAVSSRWRQSQAALQEEGAPRWAELDHVFTSLLQDRLSTGRMVMALLQELENEAVASGQTAIEEALREEMFAETAFWRDLAIRHGESVHGRTRCPRPLAGCIARPAGPVTAQRHDRASPWVAIRRRANRCPIPTLRPGRGLSRATARDRTGECAIFTI